MKDLSQDAAPIYEAMRRQRAARIVPFDVPGHKGGRGTPELTRFLSADCLRADVNSSRPLDNLCHPTSVILEAETIAAQAFGAAKAFFMVGGTTSAIQSMIFSVCQAGDTLILPRNVHRSVLNALVLCGAHPVYVNPGVDAELGIALGMSVADVKKAIQAHPYAKAVLINNPTYYGVCPHVAEIVRLAHSYGMRVLADEAHGTHFYFGEGLPLSAMAAGADMAALSMHKTGGSLTQSSFLLCGASMHADAVRQVINLTQTTSASYLLLVSLDLARRHLSLHGREVFAKTVALASYAREEINALGGYRAFAKDLCNGDSVFDFDVTKLSVHTRQMGLAGIEVYELLREEYDIQIEFGDIGNILAIISSGDRAFEIERLISALSEIKRLYGKDPQGLWRQEYIAPRIVMPPQKAFYAHKAALPFAQSEGRISGDFLMCYPPGIPILAPGEIITREILDYIAYARDKNCLVMGPLDSSLTTMQVLEEE